MSDAYTISRADLAPVFGNNPRVLAQFEALQRKVIEHEDTIGANVDATNALADATFVTLSANAELPNEYVFQVGEGLSLDASGGVVALTLQAPVLTGGFKVYMAAAGNSTLALPLFGTLAVEEWFPGPYADDAAAAADGVAVGECYRKTSGSTTVPATRMT
jgi:hypothetical protein